MIDEDSLKLIDYGNSLEILDHNGEHHASENQNKFKGNSIIASKNVM